MRNHFKLIGQAMDAIDRQNVEFDALTELAESWNVLRKVAVVDDDYGRYRARYERNLVKFIEALKNNRRI